MAQAPGAANTSLSGHWSGAYAYSSGAGRVPFVAHFEEAEGRLTGSTIEPNTFADPSLEELTASIHGERHGAVVEFVKQYDLPAGGHDHPIFYAGVLDASGDRIEGRWRFPELGPGWGGRIRAHPHPPPRRRRRTPRRCGRLALSRTRPYCAPRKGSR